MKVECAKDCGRAAVGSRRLLRELGWQEKDVPTGVSTGVDELWVCPQCQQEGPR